LAQSAQRHPQKTAIIFGRKRISYKTLKDLTDHIASGLIHLGVQKGDRIAIFLDNCPEFIISYYAVVKAGAVALPINNMYKMEEANFILQDSEAVAIITSRPYIEMAESLRLRSEKLKYIICTASASKNHILDFSKIKKENPSVLKRYPVNETDIAVILYTSGTTGHPKGALLSHRNLVSNARDCAGNLKTSSNDTFICILPLFHSFAATVCMNLPLFMGSQIVVMKSLKPFKRVIRAVRNNRVSMFIGIPSIFTLLKNMKLPGIFASPLIKLFNPVRLCISGAAALPVETLTTFERKFRVPLIEGYGLTEASPVVTLNPVKGIRKPGSIGLVVSKNVQVKVVDDKENPVETGKVGELLVKGPSVMLGYLKQEEATRQVLKNGWLYTGDMARIDKDGYVYIAGRKKEMVNVRGLNVYPREIEEVLYQNAKVKEAAVIGIKDEHKGEVPKGFIVLKEDAQATEREIIHYLRDKLAPYKIPKRIEFRKYLPKNASGKILKRLLEEDEKKN